MSPKKQLVFLAGIGVLVAAGCGWELPGFSGVKPGSSGQPAPRASAEDPPQ